MTGAKQIEAQGGCLLYTSDAADERSSVDLGGRRIIKKKKNEYECRAACWSKYINTDSERRRARNKNTD